MSLLAPETGLEEDGATAPKASDDDATPSQGTKNEGEQATVASEPTPDGATPRRSNRTRNPNNQ